MRELFRLIDWFLALPGNLELEVRGEIDRIEQEKHMPYITSIERMAIEEGMAKGMEKGMEKAIELGLIAKFGEGGRVIMDEVLRKANVELYQLLAQRIPTAESLDDIRVVLSDRSDRP